MSPGEMSRLIFSRRSKSAQAVPGEVKWGPSYFADDRIS